MPSWREFLHGPSSASHSTIPHEQAVHHSSEPHSRTTTPLQHPRRYDSNQPPYSSAGTRQNTPPTQPVATPSRTRSHGRSISQNLPAIVGSSRRYGSSDEDMLSKSVPAASDDHVRNVLSPRKKGRRPQVDEADLQTGTCATCASRVRWPCGVTEFRCGRCWMINDLKPFRKGEHARHTGLNEPLPERRHETPLAFEVIPISLDRTRAIIDKCIDTFLAMHASEGTRAEARSIKPLGSPSKQMLNVDLQLERERTPVTPGSPVGQEFNTPNELTPQHVDGEESRQPRTSYFDSDDSRNLHNPQKDQSRATKALNMLQINPQKAYPDQIPQRPTRKPPPPPTRASTQAQNEDQRNAASSHHEMARDQAVAARASKSDDLNTHRDRIMKSIFKPLEDYILRSFGDFESLNTSFLTHRPSVHHNFQSDEDARTRLQDIRPGPNPPDSGLSELDAKTLLLGDVAENGLWWTGRDVSKDIRKPERDKSVKITSRLVRSRSPCISWHELEQWYNMVLRAGEDWRNRRKLSQRPVTQLNEDPLVKEADDGIDTAFANGRVHVQRTLLRICENLLKRPSRPLKQPDDTRFLIILLTNPLLYPSKAASLPDAGVNDSHVSESATQGRFKNSIDNGRPINRSLSINVPRPEHAFGLIKRILGLLANLSNDCHRYLTAWFARLDESRFHDFVDLVQGFVNNRMTRQQGKTRTANTDPTADLIPNLTGSAADTSAQLHAVIGLGPSTKGLKDGQKGLPLYSDDWQVKAAGKVMALLFSANKNFHGERTRSLLHVPSNASTAEKVSRHSMKNHGQLLSTSDFYNSTVDFIDLVTDFDLWESMPSKFSFCQYPFFLSVGSKIKIMEHDARRQMELKAREAFFDSILKNKSVEQYLTLRVRRECLVEDSLKKISEVVGAGQEDVKKGLKVQFVGEEGIDAGGLRKEWFVLLAREIFDPHHGMFLYDEDSNFCYFNPNTFETSDQFFLIGAALGLAIYNSTILDVALPPFTFKKLLMSSPTSPNNASPFNRTPLQYTIDDLAEYRPRLASGLRQLLEFDGNVEETFCRNFVVASERYGSIQEVPLCPGGANRAVTNSNRDEFVELYIRYMLDVQVVRQFEPFKRGFFTVCGGNALSLFQPEEIELLIRGSDERLDVQSLKAVAVYSDNWVRGDRKADKPQDLPLIQWFWDFFEAAEPTNQRRLLSFITGSDRVPAVGATSLIIRIGFAGQDNARFPIARTCFNQLLLYKYRSKNELESKLWRAVTESEGFGLK